MRNSGKVQNYYQFKLGTCFCLAAVTMAFTMGVLVAPSLKLPILKATILSSEDPFRQLMAPHNHPRSDQSSSTSTRIVQPVEEPQPAISGFKKRDDDIAKATTNNTSVASHSQPPPKRGKECDIFQGAWVEDDAEPLYRNETCPILTQTQNCPGNGRPDSGYLHWRWKPNGCELPRFDARAFLELMRGKTMAFIGDSVARNQYEALLCSLWQVSKTQPNGNRKYQSWVFQEYGFKVMRIWSSWLVRSSTEAIQFAPENMTKLHLDELDEKISEFLPMFDVLVIASGHWWVKTAAYIVEGKVVGGQDWWDKNHTMQHDVLSGFSVAMKTALKAIMSHPEYKGLTILRTYSPDHYEGGEWNTGGSCTGKTKPLTENELPENTYMDTLYNHQMAAFKAAEPVGRANSKKLRVMDVTRPFAYRADGHPGPYRNNDPNKKVKRGPDGRPPPQDCLHWCMPGPIDTWNEYLLAMLKREYQQ